MLLFLRKQAMAALAGDNPSSLLLEAISRPFVSGELARSASCRRPGRAGLGRLPDADIFWSVQ